MFHGHSNYFQKATLGRRPMTKPWDHDTPNVHNHWFILIYQVRGHAWINIHWNSIWLRARSHMTSHYTLGSVTTLHDFGGVLGTAFGHFLLGSHNFMVMALGLCVKWPTIPCTQSVGTSVQDAHKYQVWFLTPKTPPGIGRLQSALKVPKPQPKCTDPRMTQIPEMCHAKSRLRVVCAGANRVNPFSRWGFYSSTPFWQDKGLLRWPWHCLLWSYF